MDALTEAVAPIFKSSPESSHRWQLQRFSDESRHPTSKYCDELENWVLAELRMMENNELIRSVDKDKKQEQQQQRGMIHQARVTEPTVQQSAVQQGQGQSPSASPQKKKSRVCFNFVNTGSCRFGENCKFNHDVVSREVAEQSQKPTGSPREK